MRKVNLSLDVGLSPDADSGRMDTQSTHTDVSRTEIAAVIDRWAAAELAGDADAAATTLTDDFAGIGPVGFVLNRDQWVARHRGGDVDNRAFDVTESDVRVYGDTAVVVATLVQETVARGHDTSASFRLGIVLRRDGAWLIAHVQFSGPLIDPGQVPGFARSQ